MSDEQAIFPGWDIEILPEEYLELKQENAALRTEVEYLKAFVTQYEEYFLALEDAYTVECGISPRQLLHNEL